MALPSYQVVVIDPTSGDVTNIYDNTAFIDLRYSRVLNGIGLLALVLPGTDLNYETFTLDSLIEVQRTDPATGALIVEDTYFCRLRERYRDDRIERVVIGGVSLNHLLMRRVVRPEDDPAVAGGYSTKDGPADTVIRAYVREQAADLASAARQFPGFTVNSVAAAVSWSAHACATKTCWTWSKTCPSAGRLIFRLDGRPAQAWRSRSAGPASTAPRPPTTRMRRGWDSIPGAAT